MLSEEFEPGTIVVITAPNFVRGEKIGVVLQKCKDHEDHLRVQLFDPNIITKQICVGTTGGDSIRKA